MDDSRPGPDEEQIRAIVRDELADESAPITRRDALKGGGLLAGLAALGGGATGSAAAALDDDAGDALAVGSVTASTYQITGNKYGGPDGAQSELTSELGSDDAGAKYVAPDTGAKYHWTGSAWELMDSKRRSLSTNKGNNTINIRDSHELQNRINDLSTGQRAEIDPGASFAPTSKIEITAQDVTLDGQGATISAGTEMQRLFEVADGVTVANLTLDGENQVPEAVVCGHGNTFRNCEIQNFTQTATYDQTTRGIHIVNGGDFLADNCHIHSLDAPQTGVCFGISGNASDAFYDGFTVRGCRIEEISPVGNADGISVVNQIRDIKVINNTFINVHKSDVKIQNDEGNAVIEGNTHRFNDQNVTTYAAIRVQTGGYASVSNNIVDYNDVSSAGIKIQDNADNVDINGNVMQFDAAESATDGILVASSPSDVTIQGGSIEGPLTDGVRFSGAPSGATVTGVGFRGFTRDGVRVAGDAGTEDVTVTGCTCHDVRRFFSVLGGSRFVATGNVGTVRDTQWTEGPTINKGANDIVVV